MSQSQDDQHRKDENPEEKKKLKIDKKTISELNEEEQEALEGGKSNFLCKSTVCQSAVCGTYVVIYSGGGGARGC